MSFILTFIAVLFVIPVGDSQADCNCEDLMNISSTLEGDNLTIVYPHSEQPSLESVGYRWSGPIDLGYPFGIVNYLPKLINDQWIYTINLKMEVIKNPGLCITLQFSTIIYCIYLDNVRSTSIQSTTSIISPTVTQTPLATSTQSNRTMTSPEVIGIVVGIGIVVVMVVVGIVVVTVVVKRRLSQQRLSQQHRHKNPPDVEQHEQNATTDASELAYGSSAHHRIRPTNIKRKVSDNKEETETSDSKVSPSHFMRESDIPIQRDTVDDRGIPESAPDSNTNSLKCYIPSANNTYLVGEGSSLDLDEKTAPETTCSEGNPKLHPQ